MRFPLSLKLYLASTRPSAEAAVRSASLPPRAQGPYLWLHHSTPDSPSRTAELVERLQDARNDLNILISTSDSVPPPEGMESAGVQHLEIAGDHLADMRRLVTRYAPELMIWVGAGLRPGLVIAAEKENVPLIMIDGEAPHFPGIERRWLPGLAKPLLRSFRTILARDPDAIRALVRQGAPRASVRLGGALETLPPPPPCSFEARDDMARRLAARPLWMAARATAGEEEILEAVQRHVSRISHRLMLVLEPEDESRGEALAMRLEKAGWRIALRSRGDEPDGETQICITDDHDEHGLWLRLAPVCFLGGTLSSGATVNPMEPAALGSAILHGPHTGEHLETCLQLDNAGAARLVLDQEGLARAIEAMLAPHKAAAMANAAWEYHSSTSLATGRICDLLLEALAERADKEGQT